MAIQKPDLSKFKRQASDNNKKSATSQKEESGSMIMEMGKVFLPKLSPSIKCAVGFAVFIMAWGLVSFNYCMVTWFHWWYLFGIVSLVELIQISNDFKFINKLTTFIKKLQPNG